MLTGKQTWWYVEVRRVDVRRAANEHARVGDNDKGRREGGIDHVTWLQPPISDEGGDTDERNHVM